MFASTTAGMNSHQQPRLARTFRIQAPQLLSQWHNISPQLNRCVLVLSPSPYFVHLSKKHAAPNRNLSCFISIIEDALIFFPAPSLFSMSAPNVASFEIIYLKF